ncbi:MAG: twin-arginine translocation signal domain-containing protein [Gemmatimonadota bacterium]
MTQHNRTTRREFVTEAGALAAAASLGTLGSLGMPAVAHADSAPESPHSLPVDWDLSWVDGLATATDRAVFDWPSLGDPADPMTMQLAGRYLDGCAAVYAGRTYRAAVVLNIRTTAVPAGLHDRLWEKYALGVEYKTNDPHTRAPAVRNPFWHPAPELMPGYTSPSISTLVGQGAIALVCDFALGHLAKRLAAARKETPDAVHADLRAGLVRGAFAVPSGIYGMAKAQNAGCGLVRM